MGQTNEGMSELERFAIKLNENISLPLYLCFIVQTNDAKRDFISKLGEIVSILDKKHMCIRNNYALLLKDYEVKFINFCNQEKFINAIRPIISDNKRNQTYITNRTDIYQKAYDDLIWKNSIRIVVNMNLTKNIPSDYEFRIKANCKVDMFYVKSIENLDLIIDSFQNIESKKIEEKLTPKNYMFSISDKEKILKYRGKRYSLNPTSNVINQKFLSSLQTIEQLNQLMKKSLQIEEYDFEIEKVPFSKGKEIYCFKGSIYETKMGRKLTKVFKLPQYVEIKIEDNFVAQLIASFLAREYSQVIGENLLVEYSEPSLAVIKVDGKERVYLMEDYCEGNFTKFTSNAVMMPVTDYTIAEKYLIDFSHWSHEWTNGKLMVVDLQGWQIDERFFCLTDPAIHSEAKLFGKTDMGPMGFTKYYAFHKEICVLKPWFPLKKTITNHEPNDLTKIEDKLLKQLNPNENRTTNNTNVPIIKQQSNTVDSKYPLDQNRGDDLKSTEAHTKTLRQTNQEPMDTSKIEETNHLTQRNPDGNRAGNSSNVPIIKQPPVTAASKLPLDHNREHLKSNLLMDRIKTYGQNIAPKFLTTVIGNKEVKREKFSTEIQSNMSDSIQIKNAILPLEQRNTNSNSVYENKTLTPSNSLSASNRTTSTNISINQFHSDKLIFAELVNITRNIHLDLNQLDKALMNESLKDANLKDTIKRIWLILSELVKKEGPSNSWKFYSENLISTLVDIYKKIYNKHRNKTFQFKNPNSNVYHINSALDSICTSAVQLFFLLSHSNFEVKFDLARLIIYIHLKLDLNQIMNKFISESVPRYDKFFRLIGDDRYYEEFKKAISQFSSNIQKAQTAMTKTTTNTITNNPNVYSDHTKREPYRRWQVLQTKFANMNDQYRVQKALEAVVLAIKEVVKELQMVFNKIDFSESIRILEDIPIKIESRTGSWKFFWIERGVSVMLDNYIKIYNLYKRSLDKNDMENAYMLVSSLTLICEMVIEIYEIFHHQMNPEITKRIIDVIYNLQVNLQVRSPSDQLWENWIAYFIGFVERYSIDNNK